jgi:geranyl-CoA carboxylase alpha subunit
MMFRPFSKLLVANRGEIACRVIRTAKAKGFATVAVASEADINARHARLADEVVVIGPPPVAQSYLDPAKLIDAAVRSGADAVHPGYGFLSERADFAQACIDQGLVFVGPTAAAIRAMGDKAESKRRMIAAGVPCVPGYEGEEEDDARLLQESGRIGFPIMVKASAGGGGRGMRLVANPDDLPAALASARSEARGAFGDDRLLLERAVIEPRHIEIQVFGDAHGKIVHLGERDCSVQRRHQKVVEESPSMAVDAALRERMGAAAVKAAQSIGYVGAGTVEFLLDGNGQFYFLEMNTRLQVEHPVTELVTGLDLVGLQLDVAAGRTLPLDQADVRLAGHAIEVRLYAEDPAANFTPQTGEIAVWSPAEEAGLRIDHGLLAGAQITPFYDPLLAKVIAYGEDREESRRRLIRGLANSTALGIATNKEFLIQILEEQEFVDGEATTAFIARNFGEDRTTEAPGPDVVALAAVLLTGWQSNIKRTSQWSGHPVMLEISGTRLELRVGHDGLGWVVDGEAHPVRIEIVDHDADSVRWLSDRRIRSARYLVRDGEVIVDIGHRVFHFGDLTYAPPQSSDTKAGGDVRAPMSGSVVAVHVAEGDVVKRGTVLIVLEAMKMEHQIMAPLDGTVTLLATAVGAQVDNRALLATIDIGDEG